MSTANPHQPDLKARSPWASLHGISQVTLTPPKRPVSGTISIPGSKSYTNRALIIAAAAQGVSTLGGILKSDDSYWCIEALSALGIASKIDGDRIVIEGCGGNWPTPVSEIYLGAGGTTARFLTSVLAASRNTVFNITASERMSTRPMGELYQALRALGADLTQQTQEKSFPLAIRGKGLRGGRIEMSGATSSQFISGVLIASPLAETPVTITLSDTLVQHAYVDMTIQLMRSFGASVERDKSATEFHVTPGGYQAKTLDLEADASTCCYFLALAALTGGCIRITNISKNTTQPDLKFTEILSQLGAHVTVADHYVEVVGNASLRGGFTANLKEISDQTLTLAALAVFANAPITITDVAHIRNHECDRISAICQELARAGIRTEEHRDGLTVYPGTPTPCTFETHDDHRIAMSLSLLAARHSGFSMKDPGCVSKTCPHYFSEIRSLGFGVTEG
jgi:3-phosphoshikimate 1-carboxyvinyltransferase